MEEKRQSLVGRYLKALCDEPNGADYSEGDYIKIGEVESDGVVICDDEWYFSSDNWEGCDVELMPEGFELSDDMAINIYMEQELKFRDEFKPQLDEIDKKEAEAVCDIFEKSISNKPLQYQIGIDTFQRMEANCEKEEILAFCKGNIDKYNWRKKGSDLEDYKKIIDYAKLAIKQLEKC